MVFRCQAEVFGYMATYNWRPLVDNNDEFMHFLILSCDVRIAMDSDMTMDKLIPPSFNPHTLLSSLLVQDELP